MANRIDSNVTGLRFAEEASLGVLPGSPVWRSLEPNSYNDFGGKISTVARSPITPTRQRRKGTVTDLEASGGFQQDLTKNNSLRLLQGAMFADVREKGSTAKTNATAIAVTAVDGTAETYAVDNDPDLGFLVNHLVLAAGFTTGANNGLKKLTAVSTTLLTVTENITTEASPPANAKLDVVGYEFASATLDVTIVSGLPRLSRVSGAFDLTTLGLVPGEWIFVGGDTTATQFTNNRGFARVNAVAASYIELDKTDWTPQAEVGTAKTIRIFFGSVVKNESTSALIKRKTYQLERTLGEDTVGTMSEYIVGAVVNEMTLNIAESDKVTVDWGFVATDHEQRNGTTGVKAGTRPTLTAENPFNTSSDFSRIKLALVSTTDPHPASLFGFGTEVTLKLNNNVKPTKAIGTLGAFDATAGTFEIGGSVKAYFSDVSAIQAVRNNSDATLDVAMVNANSGFVVDIPLMTLSDGRLDVAMDESIMVPLEINAIESKFGHTLLINFFPYLPDLAG